MDARASNKGVDGAEDKLAVVVGECGDGVESCAGVGVGEVVGATDEVVDEDVEGLCEAQSDLDGGFSLPALVASDAGAFGPDTFGEVVLGEPTLFANLC